MISYTIKHPLLYYDKVYKEKVGGIIRKEKPNSSKQVDNCSKLNFDSTFYNKGCYLNKIIGPNYTSTYFLCLVTAKIVG